VGALGKSRIEIGKFITRVYVTWFSGSVVSYAFFFVKASGSIRG